MPALKRARPASLTSPPSPSPPAARPRPLPSVAEKHHAEQQLLRPSLRHWREGSVLSVTSSDSDADDVEIDFPETDAEDVDEHRGGLEHRERGAYRKLSTLEEEMASGRDSDDDVDAALAPGTPRTPRTPRTLRTPRTPRDHAATTEASMGPNANNGKGKSVDPREYGARYAYADDRKEPALAPPPSQPERVLKRRIPKQAKAFLSRRRTGRRIPSSLNLRNPRRIVSPTESVFAITDRIDSLATDHQDEQDVHHTLLVDDADDEGSTPPPKSPSPAPLSDTETDDVPTSPLASKSRRAAAKKRRHRKHADQHGKRKKTADEDEDDRAEAVRALESLASAAGFKLVPISPGAEPIEADPTPEFIVPPPVKLVPFGDDAPVPEKKLAAETIVNKVSVETLHDTPRETPRKRRAAEPTFTEPAVTRARQRYAATIPKSKDPVTPLSRRKRHDVVRSLPRSVGPETSHLHRKSPTSLIPSRDRLRTKPRVRFARRPVVLHRPKRPSTFVAWSAADDSVPILPGAVYAAALRERAVNHRVRSNLLKRYRERVFSTSGDLFTSAPAAASSHRHHRSHSVASASDDEQVEALLPSDDVEMLDSEAVDAALSPSRERSPSVSHYNRPLKRPAVWGTGEVASRRAVHSSLHHTEMIGFAESIRFHITSRREKHAAVREHAAARVREAVAAALAALEEERRAEEAELARLAREAQAELDAENARLHALSEAEAQAQAEAAQTASQFQARARQRAGVAHRRRRAADSVAAQLAVRPRTRLAAIDRHRLYSAPPSNEAGPSRTPASRAASSDPEARNLTPEADDAPVAGPSVPAGLRSPVQLVPALSPPTPAPHSGLDLEIVEAPPDLDPEPPRYEYPFFPIIRAAPPVHLRPVTPARRVDPDSVSPPAYVPSRYSRRTPSPPPPYNAQTDCDTLVRPVFQREASGPAERQRDRALDRQRQAAMEATHHRVRPHSESISLAGAHPHRAPPLDDDTEMETELELEAVLGGDVAQQEDENDNVNETTGNGEAAGDTGGRPIIGAIRRWLGW